MNGRKWEDAELSYVLEKYQALAQQGRPLLDIYKEIGLEIGRHPEHVGQKVREYRPTVKLAVAKVRARAAKLIERVMEKGTVDQTMDLLSRANIGVLEPIRKSGGEMAGAQVLVNIGSLGAASISVGEAPAPQMDPLIDMLALAPGNPPNPLEIEAVTSDTDEVEAVPVTRYKAPVKRDTSFAARQARGVAKLKAAEEKRALNARLRAGEDARVAMLTRKS